MPAGATEKIVAWESEGLSNEKIKDSTTANDSLSAKLKWHNSKIRVEFKGTGVKQDKVTISLRDVVNLFIVYELLFFDLFGAIK